MAARAVSSAWAMTVAASASLSRLVWSTNFWASKSVRCSVSSESAAASAGRGGGCLVSFGDRRCGALVALELRDALAGLTQPLVQLADVLLEGFGLLRRLVQVLIDLIDVVALQPKAELHGAECVED